MRRGGGGAKMKIYTAAALGSLPAGVVGDIGIITTQAIGKIYVGNETVSSPAENDIILNTTHKNNGCPITLSTGARTIYVYLYRCTQYSGGVWVVRVLYVKTASAWTAPYAYLYILNQEFEAFTGGFQKRAWGATSGIAGVPTTLTLTKNSDHMLLVGSGTDYSAWVVEVISNIDLTNFSTLAAIINNVAINTRNANQTVRLTVVPRGSAYWVTSQVGQALFLDSTGVDQTQSINVESLNGSYDILIGIMNSYPAGCQVKIKEIRLA